MSAIWDGSQEPLRLLAFEHAGEHVLVNNIDEQGTRVAKCRDEEVVVASPSYLFPVETSVVHQKMFRSHSETETVADSPYVFTNEPHYSPRFFAPATAEKLDIDIRPALVQFFGPTVGQIDFSDAFENLWAIASTLKNTPIDDLNRDIERRIKSTSEHIEVLGISLPRSTLSVWGPLTILLIQLYLMSHFGRLCAGLKSNESAFDAAWVGLYRDMLSIILTYLSIVGLPLFTVVFLVSHGSYQIGEWDKWTWCFAVGATSSAVLTFWYLYQVTARLGHRDD